MFKSANTAAVPGNENEFEIVSEFKIILLLNCCNEQKRSNVLYFNLLKLNN